MYVMLRKRGDSPNRAIRVIILPKVYYDFSQWARNQRKIVHALQLFLVGEYLMHAFYGIDNLRQVVESTILSPKLQFPNIGLPEA